MDHDTLASCCCIKSRRRPYAMLSKKQWVLAGRQHREAVAESVTDSGNSCAREDPLGRQRHTSQSSYVMNDSEIRQNTVIDLTEKISKNGRLSWVPCIVYNKRNVEDTRLGIEESPCRRQSLASNISNSSLKDVDRAALEDELTLYMKELARREQKQEYVHNIIPVSP